LISHNLPGNNNNRAVVPEWDTRAQVDSGALEAAFRWAAHMSGRDGPNEAGEERKMSEWQLGTAEVQNVLVQMGLEPLWKGSLKDFSPLERMIWSSCQEVLRHLTQKKKGCFDFASCRKLVMEVRRIVRRLAEDFLKESLPCKTVERDTEASCFPAGLAIAALQVTPHTPAERSALCQELEAGGGDCGTLPCKDLSDISLRAQERLQRDRRADELQIAEAIGLESELHRIRTSFIEEAFLQSANKQRGSVMPGPIQRKQVMPAKGAKQVMRARLVWEMVVLSQRKDCAMCSCGWAKL